MNQVGRELHYLVPSSPRRGKGRFDILENLSALGVKIIFADNISRPVGCEHAGDEKELAGFDPGYVRVLPKGFPQGISVVDLDFGH
jgi:hypothetical protein